MHRHPRRAEAPHDLRRIAVCNLQALVAEDGRDAAHPELGRVEGLDQGVPVVDLAHGDRRVRVDPAVPAPARRCRTARGDAAGVP